MTLDLTTLLVVSPLIIVTCCVLYLTSSARRHGVVEVDRCWALTFISLLMTSVAYLVSGLDAVAMYANAVGNSAFVFALGTLWSGVRAFDGRPARLWIVGASTLVTGLAALAPGSDGGVWAGAWAYFAGLVIWPLAAAVAILRGRLRRYPAMSALASVSAIYAFFTLARAIIAFTAGFDDPLFLGAFGSEVATIVGMLVAVVGSFSMITVRAPEANSERLSELRFDPYLGLRTAASLSQRAELTTARASAAGLPSSVALVRVRDLDEIASAFGKRVARLAFERCADELVTAVPGDVLIGTLLEADRTIAVVLPGADALRTAQVARVLEDSVRGLTISTDDLQLSVLTDLVVVSGHESWRELAKRALTQLTLHERSTA